MIRPSNPHPMNAIELVVFDMAGTTVYDDDAVNQCLRAALGAHGILVTRHDVNTVMGLPKPLAIEHLARRHRGTQPEPAFVTEVHQNFLQRMIAFYRSDPEVCEMPGATALFHHLHRHGIRVALDTGFSRDIVDTIVHRLGWLEDDLLDATVASDEVARGRPHPDLVHRAMQLTRVSNPAAVAKVGDTPSDLHEGTAAGCGLVIGITHGSHTAAELAVHPHTHLVANLEGVRTLVTPAAQAA